MATEATNDAAAAGAEAGGQQQEQAQESTLDAVQAALKESTLQFTEPTADEKARLDDEKPVDETAAPAADGTGQPAKDAKPADGKAADGKPADGQPPVDPVRAVRTPLDDLAKDAGKGKGRLTDEDLALPKEYEGHDKGKLAERWGKLQGGYREQAARADAAEARVAELTHESGPLAQLEYIQGTMQQIGAQAEQVDTAVEFIGRINSGDLAGARTMLMEALTLVDAHLGTSSGAVDLVGQNADLKAAVESGAMTEEWAEKMAQMRIRDGLAAERAQGAEQSAWEQQQQAQVEDQQAAVLMQASEDVNVLDRHLAATDPEFGRLRPILESTAMQMADNPQMYPPENWVPILMHQYRSLKAMGQAPPMEQSPNGAGGLAHAGNGAGGRQPQFQRPGTSGGTADVTTVANARNELEASQIALRNAGLMVS